MQQEEIYGLKNAVKNLFLGLIYVLYIYDLPTSVFGTNYCLTRGTNALLYPSGSQTCSSRYPNQGSDYVSLPSIF